MAKSKTMTCRYLTLEQLSRYIKKQIKGAKPLESSVKKFPIVHHSLEGPGEKAIRCVVATKVSPKVEVVAVEIPVREFNKLPTAKIAV